MPTFTLGGDRLFAGSVANGNKALLPTLSAALRQGRAAAGRVKGATGDSQFAMSASCALPSFMPDAAVVHA